MSPCSCSQYLGVSATAGDATSPVGLRVDLVAAGRGFPTVIGGIKYNSWCIQLIKTGKFQIAISREVVSRSSASIGRGTVGWRILSVHCGV